MRKGIFNLGAIVLFNKAKVNKEKGMQRISDSKEVNKEFRE